MTPKRIVLSIVTVIVLGVGAYVAWSAHKPVELPQSFLDARQNVGAVSQKIVDITTSVGEKIKALNSAEASGDHATSSILLQQARDLNAEAYQQAVLLAGFLQKWAASLQDIPSQDSQRIAYEAVSFQLSLVSEYIVYTADLNAFFDAIGNAAATNSAANQKAVQDSLAAVNQKGFDINTINQSFVSKMKEFDQSL